MSASQLIANRFEIKDLERDLLGRGGMGDVYRANDAQTGEPVAVKALNPGVVARDPDIVARFVREGEALCQLNHPNIVKMVAAIEEGGRHYLVMEYVEGGSLQDLLAAQGPLPSVRVVEIALDLADALTRAHRLGIIHRDLKPANVLLAEDGTPRLTDFGMAQVADSPRLTETGMLVGTVDYLSPEACQGEPLDERADIWAFGVMLYEMLTGERPFRGKTLSATLMAILTQPVPDPAQLSPGIPEAMVDLVYRMLEKDRQQRIPSVRLVGVELEAILKGREVPTPVCLAPAESRFAPPTPPTQLPSFLGKEEPVERSVKDKLDQITNVPIPRNPLIGREQELATACNLLMRDDVGMVTLTGPGGTGKSRLGIQIALDLRDHFTDGVYLVGLESISDPNLVIPTIAKTLGVTETAGGPSLADSLKGYLYNKQMLLLLDNFEQVLAAAPQTAELLEACPRAKILITSRAPLHLRAEKVLPVPPLAVPPLKEVADLQGLSQYSAVQLFVQRTQSVKPDFQVTTENAPAVAEICHRLEGLPLAIELASGRSRILSPQALLTRLERRFEVLRGGTRDLPERQHTMYSAIDWSYNLLNENEKRLLRCLSVFVGDWTFEAADAVCNADDTQQIEVFDGLEILIDNSLLQPPEDVDGELRLKMLETIREYASEQLALSRDEERTVQRKHAHYYLALAEQAEPEIHGMRQLWWLDRLEREHDNLRAALNRSIETGMSETALRFGAALWRFWEIRGYISEGRAWLERALAMNPDAPAPLCAIGLQGAGNLACQQGDYIQAKAIHEQSLALFRETGDQLGIARELDVLGEIAHHQGNYSQSVELHMESLDLKREIGDKEGIAVSLGHLGIIARDRGQYQQARELLEESLELSRVLEDRLMTALSLNNLGLVAFYLCEYQRASELFEESVSLYRQLNDRPGISNVLQNLGNVAKDQGYFQRATSLYRECLQLKQELSDRRGIAQATASLAEVAFYQGNYPHADNLAEQSQTLFRELGVKRGVVFSLGIQAYIALYRGDFDRAQSLAQECLTLSTEINAPRPVAYSKMVFGLWAYGRGNLEEAKGLFHEALDIFQKVGDRRNVAAIGVNLARTAYRQGDHNCARQFLNESLSLSRELETLWTVSFCLEILGLLERDGGNYSRALDYFKESLQLSVEQANQQGIANCLGALAGIAAQGNQFVRAAHLFAAAEKLRQTMGVKMGDVDLREYEGYLAILRDQLDNATFTAAWSEGSLMTMKQILEDLKDWSGNSMVV